MDEIKKLDPESTDVISSNMITAYQKRSQRHFSNYTLADFVVELTIIFPNTKAREDYYAPNSDDYPLEELCEEDSNGLILLQFRNGMKIIRRKIPRIIRYVNYNKYKDKENYCRERLMLFRPWKNEEQDLLDKYDTYEHSYKAYKSR